LQNPINPKKTLEIIQRLKFAKIGEYKKWDKIVKKINEGTSLSDNDYQYISTFSRTYRGQKTTRSKIYHTKLSDFDERHPCKTCGNDSMFYCNMNDEYFCIIHVVGHDENEW